VRRRGIVDWVNGGFPDSKKNNPYLLDEIMEKER
jgi:hypothetical protein